MRIASWPLWSPLLTICLMAAELPAGYTEPGTCTPCHAAIAASYAKTPMATTFGAVSDDIEVPPLATFSHKLSGQTFAIAKRGSKAFLERSEGRGRHALAKPLDYWIGSGKHARSYISRTAAGDLIELPLSWYSEKQGYWDMSPAYDIPQHAGFSRKITYRCMFCHNAYPALPAGSDALDSATRWPANLPSGIDCQRCHGPGERHVEAARAGLVREQVRTAITNPARLDPVSRTEICVQCHLETTNAPLPGFLKRPDRGVFSWRPGEPLGEYGLFFDHGPGSGRDGKFEFASAPYRLRQSQCFLKGSGEMTCTTCHDPHGTTTVTNYDAACRSCHRSLEQQHAAQRNCSGCHMPRRRPDDAVHVTITDHRITRTAPKSPEPDLTLRSSQPWRGPVVLYYPPATPDEATRDLWLAVAQVVDHANLDAGVPALEQAVARWKPQSGYFYSVLGNAYRARARDPRSAFLEALRRNPNDVSALIGLGGEGQLRRALSLAPWNSEITKNLARLLSESGRITEAVELLRAYVRADPDAADVHNSLGLALLRLGEAKQAEASLQEAVRLRPESPAMRVNLGTVLARRADWEGARYEFTRALQLGARDDIHLAFGSVLVTQGDLAAAVVQYRSAIRLNPRSATAWYNLGLILARTRAGNDWREAMDTAAGLARESNLADVLAAAEHALRAGSSSPP